MKYFLPILLICLLSCKSDNNVNTTEPSKESTSTELKMEDQAPAPQAEFPFYVGTYTNGESEGIYKYVLQGDGKMNKIGLAAKTDNPSFLGKTSDEKYVVAVNEIDSADGKGTVESFEIVGDNLVQLSKQSSGGAHPCHVSINKKGDVLVSNYSSGNVGYLKLDSIGRLSELMDVQQHKGKGKHHRQTKPHAHSAWFVPHSDEIISVDLGTNDLWFSHIDPLYNEFQPADVNKIPMVVSAGPRHLTFHPRKNIIYVLNELNGTITLINEDDAGIRKVGQTISTLPNDYKGENTCADIHISRDNKFVYASNRGHNSIAIFKVNNKDGTLSLVGHESTKGENPRNFSISPNGKYLLVANQTTNNIISFSRNSISGLLTFVEEIDAPTPVCILF